jgi:hypothetical protein
MKTVRVGSVGQDVVAWQRVIGVTADGIFGPATRAATIAWQKERGLEPDGIAGPRTWQVAGIIEAPPPIGPLGFQLVPTQQFNNAARGVIDLIVIHTAECGEVRSAAENVAAWGARPASQGGPGGASWHFMVDADSITQSVLEKDIAWHAGPVNGYSIGVEHAGYHHQTPAQWADAYTKAMLERSAQLVGDLCRRYGIPVRRLTADELKRGERFGITGHVDVTLGLTNGKGHQDPGPHFPWDWYLSRVSVHAQRFVRVEHEGVEYEVAPTYIAPVGIAQAAQFAKARGFELPTPALVDAIWKAADLKVEPQPQSPNRGDDIAQFAEHATAVEAAVAGRSFQLLAGTHKDVVRTAEGLALYGWHHEDGSVIQPPYGGHAGSWRDYSQGLRLVRRVS